MANTENLNLTYLEASQAQKEVTTNEFLTTLDGIVQLSVLDRDLTAPPVSPNEGDRYIIASSATGNWSGQDGKIAHYYNSGWRFYTPKSGWLAYVQDERLTLTYTGSAWETIASRSVIEEATGEYFRFARKEADVTLSSGSTINVTDFIDDRSIVFGIHARVMTAVTGASSFNVGLSGQTTKFGGSIGIAVDSTNIGVINPEAFFADTTVQLSANGSAFTGGQVKLIQHYAQLRGNWTW